MKKKLRLYMDTSVFGGYFDKELEIRSPRELLRYENEE